MISPLLPVSTLVLVAFALAYAGMALGRIPGLRIDRAGIALVAATVLVAGGAVPLGAAARFVDVPTLVLLFALMLLSAQFAVSGFYDRVAAWLAQAGGSPERLLALVIGVSGLLSTVLANDIVAWALAPLLAVGITRRGLDPVPFLLGLMCACNAGSAATLIGNPQNILIGQLGGIDFWGFAAVATPVAVASLGITWAVIAWQWRGRFEGREEKGGVAVEVDPEPLDPFQLGKALFATIALIALFSTQVPRELSALAIAAALLLSHRVSSRALLANVDWNLLLLFASLFVVTGVLSEQPGATGLLVDFAARGWALDQAHVLTPLLVVLSNTIGNVPGVVLLLQLWPGAPEGALAAMAILSTLAGNLLLVGSLANIIVAERAAGAGVSIGFREHARVGIPVGLATVALATGWLVLLGRLAP
jgi:Na+/H+ antiporter NhaD/arsenite permease-like protein